MVYGGTPLLWLAKLSSECGVGVGVASYNAERGSFC